MVGEMGAGSGASASTFVDTAEAGAGIGEKPVVGVTAPLVLIDRKSSVER